jgi:hypothetical protein
MQIWDLLLSRTSLSEGAFEEDFQIKKKMAQRTLGVNVRSREGNSQTGHRMLPLAALGLLLGQRWKRE